ncbi:glycosyltransferase family 2 protein [Lactobacillus johnsonii]|uniref:Glycosyltransferase n=1 Tax=Lactobacillus johnsonii (strain FI9785) TaxID=633699 RepID=D0R4M5_LACJF|nr:glycosyltransferase family 2 protein [Lactobacillus johnsonii]CAX67038.1 glycosyltransferase [Lactobacillus johnsonii FI9785]
MKINIIVPVYNAEKYLKQNIECVLNQDYKNINLILVDDGSDDNSFYICKKYAQMDDRIILVHQDNSGVSVARNKGLEYVDGEYFTFLDVDDFIDNEYVANVANTIEKENPDIVLTSVIKEYKNNHLVNDLFEQKIVKINGKKLLRRLIGPIKNEINHPIKLEDLNPVWGKFYKTSKFRQIRFEKNLNRSEDLLFNLNAFFLAENCVYNGNSYYHYNRINETSNVSNYDPNLFEKFKFVNTKIVEFIYHKKLNTEFQEALNNRIIANLITLAINYFGNNSKDATIKFKKILNSDYYKKAFKNFDFGYLNFKYRTFFKLCEYNKIGLLKVIVKSAIKGKRYIKR